MTFFLGGAKILVYSLDLSPIKILYIYFKEIVGVYLDGEAVSMVSSRLDPTSLTSFCFLTALLAWEPKEISEIQFF